MTLSPVPDLAELYPHMSVEMLARHLDAVVSALAAQGVAITPVARLGLEEIAEAIIEHHARHDVPALRRHLSLVGASGADRAPALVRGASGADGAPAPGMQQAPSASVHAPVAMWATEGATKGAF